MKKQTTIPSISLILSILILISLLWNSLSIFGQETQSEDANKEEIISIFKEGVQEFDGRNFDKAKKYFLSVIERSIGIEQSSELDIKEIHLSYWYLGLISRNQNDLINAIKYFEKAVEKKNDFIAGYIDLAITLSWNNKFEQSLSAYEKALSIDGKNISALNGYAKVLSWVGDFKKSLETYEKIIKLEPENISALNDYAKVLAWTGKYETALAIYDKVLKIEKNNLNALSGKAKIYSWTNKYEKALTIYKSILKIDENNIPALNGYASVLSWMKKYDEAIKIYLRVLELDNKNVDALNGYARILSWQEKYDEAEKIYYQVLTADSLNIDALLGLAFINYVKWNKEEATRLYKKVLSIQSDNKEALAGLKKLDEIKRFILDISVNYAKIVDTDTHFLKHTGKFGFRMNKDATLSLGWVLEKIIGNDADDTDNYNIQLNPLFEMYFTDNLFFESEIGFSFRKPATEFSLSSGIRYEFKDNFNVSGKIRGSVDTEGNLSGLIIPGIDIPLYPKSYIGIKGYISGKTDIFSISGLLKVNLNLFDFLELAPYGVLGYEKGKTTYEYDYIFWNIGSGLKFIVSDTIDLNILYEFYSGRYNKNSIGLSAVFLF